MFLVIHLNNGINLLLVLTKDIGAFVVVIIRMFNLQLPMQSVPITTKVVSSNPAHSKGYSIYNIM
jgi:hypothetical protein